MAEKDGNKTGNGNGRKWYSFSDLILTCLFSAGIVILFWALIEEARAGAPFYVILSSFAAALTISSTFIAVIRRK